MPLWPPPMMTTSRRLESAMSQPHVMPLQPARCGSTLEPAFRYEFAHAAREAAQRYLVAAQRSRTVAAGMHPRLHALDERLVLGAHPPIDAPVEVSGRTHFTAAIGVRIGDLAYQRFGGRNRNHLHEIDLIRIDVEGDVRPQLEIDPQTLPLVGKVRRTREDRLVHPLGTLR